MIRYTQLLVILWTFLAQMSSFLCAQQTLPGWHKNLEPAQRLAAKTGKPLLVVFRCLR